jgi:hypothetical protein
MAPNAENGKTPGPFCSWKEKGQKWTYAELGRRRDHSGVSQLIWNEMVRPEGFEPPAY